MSGANSSACSPALVTAAPAPGRAPSFAHPAAWRRAADLVAKVLNGVKPADIPIEQPTQFDLVVNVRTAKTLGLTVPTALLARADEVIE